MHKSTPKKLYRKVRKTLLVDSRDRNPGQTPAKYTVTLPKVYENVYSVALRSAEMPFSWYTFTSEKQNISFEVTYNGGTPTKITIDEGNYTSASFVAELTSKLNTAFGVGAFTLTYSDTTLKVTFVGLQDFTFTFPDSIKRSSWWGLGYFMGFLNKSYTSVAKTLSSDTVLQLNITNYILMELDFINKEDETSADSRLSGNVDGCFAKITMPVGPGGYVFFREVGFPMNRSVLSPPLSQVKSLSVKFRDHYGTLIDFNNVDHSFTLEFELLDNNFDEYSSLEFSPLG